MLFPHWDGKTKRRQPVKRDWPLFYRPSAGITMSLPSSMADFVPCDRLLQKAYSRVIKINIGTLGESEWKEELSTATMRTFWRD